MVWPDICEASGLGFGALCAEEDAVFVVYAAVGEGDGDLDGEACPGSGVFGDSADCDGFFAVGEEVLVTCDVYGFRGAIVDTGFVSIGLVVEGQDNF